MRAFLGALLLGAGASAVAVLLAVAGDKVADRQLASEPIVEACEAGSQGCDDAGVALIGFAGHVPAGEPAVRAPDIFVDHPYPDHP